MTEKEFIQKAVLNMFASTDYYCDFSYDERIGCARTMAKALKENGYDFDDDTDETKESMKTFVAQIADFLMDIRDALQAPDGTELSAIQEIATTLHEKFSPVKLK